MKKIKLFGVLLLTLTFGVVGVKALTVNEDLKLTEDLTETVEVPSGKTVTIDLNGHNITVTGKKVDAIANKGPLTIKGVGEVTAEGAAVVNYPGATITIDNGDYFSTGWYTIKNMGTMTINNMKFANDVNNGASLIDNGYVGSPSSDRGETAKEGVLLTINGGTFENKNNSCNVIKNDDYGVLVINDGTFVAGSDNDENANPVVMNWHKATINGGVFNSKNGYALANGHCSDVSDIGEMTINGGTFTGKLGLFANNGSATNGKGTLTIKGGTFHGEANSGTVYAVVIEGGIFDDDTLELSEDSDYIPFEILEGEKEGEIIVLNKDVLDELELATFPYEIDKEEIEEAMTEILDTYEKYKNGELEEELDEEYIGYLEEIKEVMDELKKHDIIGYYDVYLAGVTKDGYAIQQYEESAKPVEVTLKLPEVLPEVKEGFTRRYYVVRVHGDNNEITVIDDVTVNDDGTVTFKSDKFSLYALSYEDVENKKEEIKTEVKGEQKVVEPPKTFDSVISYIIITVIALGLITYTSLYLKKRFNH